MDPVTLLVLMCLVSFGATVVAYFAKIVLLLVASGFLFVFSVMLIAVGSFGDYFYNKKMRRDEAPFRLPWYYRWNGWKEGHNPDSYTHKNGLFHDKHRSEEHTSELQ